MYRVYVRYDGNDYPLYEPLDDAVTIFDPVFTEEVGGAGTFVFTIFNRHPYFDKIKPCRSEIILYWNQEALFYGRILKPEQGFDNMVKISCEGDMTYLLDSMQQPFAFTGSVENYFKKLLEVHNSQVEEDKRVELGNIVVTGGTDTTVRELTGFTPTLTVLRQIKNQYGGYLRIRHKAGKRYLDYLWDYGGINLQVIRFGENLLDMSKYVDASRIITCLIPHGAEVEYKDEVGATQKKTVDITAVNGGKNHIENTEAVKRYGRIYGYQKFADITDPGKLLEKAKVYLEEAASLPETIEISAVDLSLIDADVEQFRTGYWTGVSSAPHGIEKQFMLSRREINLLDPTQRKITLGKPSEAFTETFNRSQAAISERVEQIVASTIEEINRKVENATSLITGGFGGYVIWDNIDPETGKKMHPWRILIMNTPDKETAKNVIQINQNGIGFSTTGINGPYRNAWTIDGNLVADFITTGSMLADRIRGGTLELGGTGLGRDGSIVVKDANGNLIGSWDKTGISILRGILQGVSAIFGGINNQNGAVAVVDADGRTIGRWDKDGLYIIRGDISVGPFEATEEGVWFGDYFVSVDGSNVFRSSDGSIVIQNEKGGPVGSFAAMKIGDATFAFEKTKVGGLTADIINGNAVMAGPGSSQHWDLYTLYGAFDLVWERLENLEDEINSLS